MYSLRFFVATCIYYMNCMYAGSVVIIPSPHRVLLVRSALLRAVHDWQFVFFFLCSFLFVDRYTSNPLYFFVLKLLASEVSHFQSGDHAMMSEI